MTIKNQNGGSTPPPATTPTASAIEDSMIEQLNQIRDRANTMAQGLAEQKAIRLREDREVAANQEALSATLTIVLDDAKENITETPILHTASAEDRERVQELLKLVTQRLKGLWFEKEGEWIRQFHRVRARSLA